MDPTRVPTPTPLVEEKSEVVAIEASISGRSEESQVETRKSHRESFLAFFDKKIRLLHQHLRQIQ